MTPASAWNSTDLRDVRQPLRTFVRRFREALPWPTTITSTWRRGGTAHADGLAVDIALRTAGYTDRRQQLNPRYAQSPALVDATITAGRIARDAVKSDTPFLILIEHDHWHVSVEPHLASAPLTFGQYAPCRKRTLAACNPLQPLQLVPDDRIDSVRWRGRR